MVLTIIIIISASVGFLGGYLMASDNAYMKIRSIQATHEVEKAKAKKEAWEEAQAFVHERLKKIIK